MNAAKAEAEDNFGIHFPTFKFGQDNRKITADKETNSITNSLSSIKGFGNDIGKALYECSQQEHNSFVSVLKWLDEKSIKAAKVQPLIHIDYFSSFGNAKQLSLILESWDMLKQGSAKLIKKDKELPMYLKEVIIQNSTDKNANGSNSSSYKLNDAYDIIQKYENCILNNEIPDFDVKTKMQHSQEILGYINLITNKEQDRRRLLITDCAPSTDKNGNVWAYRIGTKSIGTGKTARLTVKVSTYNQHPIKTGDVVFAEEVWKNPQNYWYLLKYNIEK